MTGIESRRMRRRPTRSMIMRARRVQRKLVMAMDKEVIVGEEKSKSEKIVAEKYMREFCVPLATKRRYFVARWSYEAT